MKKLTVFLLMIALIVLPVFAAGEYTRDEAPLFTDEQAQMLEDTAAYFSEFHDFGIYIHTVWDFAESGYRDVYDYAVADYTECYGAEAQGVMLTLSMSDRDYCFVFNGPVADQAFTETGRDDLERAVLSGLRDGDYYGAFMKYLTVCDEYLTAYKEGSPIGTGTDHSQTGYVPYHSESSPANKTLLSLIPGGIAAIFTGIGTAVPMRSAKRKTDAAGYESGLNLTVRRDQFLHRSVTRTPKAQNNSSGGGSGGSIHHSSGSFSGRSGKF